MKMTECKNIVQSHNKKVNAEFLKQNQTEVKQTSNPLCNGRDKAKCPLKQECCKNKGPVVYKAALRNSNGDLSFLYLVIQND